jgi:thiol-disulfide isomerase/thioredoxin
MFKVKYDTATKKFSTKDLPESYFSFLKDIDLNDQNASDNDNYYTALDRYISEFNDLKNDKTIADSLSEAKKVEMKTVKLYYYRKKIFKGKILDYELTSFLKRVIMQNKIDKNIMDDLIRDYKTTCTNKEYISIINNTYNQVQKLGKGKPAPEFSLKDKDGKVISLTDLKGKIVYIDFWATWCGPCRAEMPDAKKLEEEFKDKDVVFLNINVEDNIELWNKYLVKNNDGINVFADGEQTKKLKEDYAFDGIPRYVLIDRNGKLLNANAARPSGNINKSITDALK